MAKDWDRSDRKRGRYGSKRIRYLQPPLILKLRNPLRPSMGGRNGRYGKIRNQPNFESGLTVTSYRQIEATRRNALKSTGPRTDSAVARSAFRALELAASLILGTYVPVLGQKTLGMNNKLRPNRKKQKELKTQIFSRLKIGHGKRTIIAETGRHHHGRYTRPVSLPRFAAMTCAATAGSSAGKSSF